MIFLFIPSMYLLEGLPVYDIVIGLALCGLLLSNKNISILKQIIKYKRFKFIKILLVYVIWIFLSGIFLIISGKYKLFYAIFAMLILFAYNNLSWFLYPSLIFPRFFSLRTLIKFLIIGIYIICIYGLLVYFFDRVGIPILKPLHQILVNRRTLGIMDAASLLYTRRVLSVFEEPGYFGGFLCINLPIIFSMILSNYKILKNKTLNSIFKKSYIPIIILTIIMIQSPIWLVLSILTILVYFRKILLTKYLPSIIVIVILASFCFIFMSVKFDISATYLVRIERTFTSFLDMEQFVVREPSLANRILSYIVRLKILCKYPITGIGYKNAEYHAKEIYYSLEYPLTLETKINLVQPKRKMGMNGSIFWDTLSDTGVVGFILYYSFLILLILKVNQKIENYPSSLEKDFLYGLKGTYIAILIYSIYDIRPNFHYFWFLYGILLCFRYNNIIKKVDSNSEVTKNVI